MVLVIDVGNTNIVMGLYDKELLIKKVRTESYDNFNFIDEFGTSIEKIMISSVKIEINNKLADEIKKAYGINPIFIEWNTDLGLKNKLSKPEELGADLFVGGFASTIKYGAPCIVIDMGTATTLFAVNKNKEMLGGIIIPGLVFGVKELTNKASLLKACSYLEPKNVIGTNTNEAISSGFVYATSTMLEGLVDKMKKELNEDKVNVIITGGVANVIYPYINIDGLIHDENLILDGLYKASLIL